MVNQIVKPLILAAVVGGVSYGLRLKRLASELVVTLAGFRLLKESNVTASYMAVKLRLDNPTTAAIRLQGISKGKIEVKGETLATYQSAKPFTIKPGRDNFVELRFNVSNAKLFQVLGTALTNPTKATITFSLDVVPFVSLPQSFEISTKQFV